MVTYVVNRNVNFTNVCVKHCGFCAFSRTYRNEEGYFLPLQEIIRRTQEAVVVSEDISARKAVERDLEASMSQMQMLATRLMHAQDDERRRIAQMLHETTAQDLAGLKMLLARLSRASDRLSESERGALAEQPVEHLPQRAALPLRIGAVDDVLDALAALVAPWAVALVFDCDGGVKAAIAALM